jgi:hypothetical protein
MPAVNSQPDAASSGDGQRAWTTPSRMSASEWYR